MKSLRKAVAIALTVLLFAGVYAGGASAVEDVVAAPDAVSIQLNGENIEFPSGVEPYFDTAAGRVFVPVRDLFTELGAEVEYDETARVITLTRGGVTVVFPQDSTTITITEGGATTTIESDVKPLTFDNRVLVPLRFVANALGSNVGWDQTAQTAIVIDPESYLASRPETFDTLGKLIEAEGEPQEGNQALTMSIDGTVTSDGMSIPLSFELEGISSQTASDLKLAGTVDLPAEMMPGLTASLAIDADVLANAETGFFAIHSELLNASLLGVIPDVAADTWITGDIYALLSEQGVDIDSILAQSEAAYAEDVGTLINDAITQQVLALGEPDDVAFFDATVKVAVDAIYGLLGDSGLTETEDGYVSQFIIEDTEIDAKAEVSLKITTDADGKAVSAVSAATVVIGGETALTLKASASEATFEITVQFDDLEGTAIDIAVKGEIAPTTEEPRAGVPEGAETIDIGVLLDATV
ncbi:MAG: copper amine oxidase N-terminal domain-containing protein [Oscillospiraceae bacterium]|jgi:hypothetical protein|nr:copper amine oxidase N-terminal domain-containing protein [Oscillospiraceae bacterium]